MSSRTTLVGVVWFLFATAASGQIDNGSIKGFISDDLGARVPDVTVTATGATLMGKRTATSDEEGFCSYSEGEGQVPEGAACRALEVYEARFLSAL